MLQAIVDSLDAAPAGSFASVDMAEDLDALAMGTAPETGAVYVVPFRERAAPNTLATGGFRQLVDVQFFVAFVIREFVDVKGRERAARFDAAKSAIEGALAGWVPERGAKPVSLVNGEGTSLGNGVTVYVQTWQTSRFLTGA